VTLNNLKLSIDTYQDATTPGTESYTTSYDEPVPTHTKLDHDHNDRRTNGIRYITQQAPIDKICNQNLKVIKKATDYPDTTPHQQPGIHIAGKFKTRTTPSTFSPIRQQTSLTTADTTEQRTKHTSPYFSNDAARNLVIDLLKNSQKLERTLREMTNYTTKILAILEPSSTHCPCNKPGIPHLGHSTDTDTKHRQTHSPTILHQKPFTSPNLKYC